MINLPFNMLGIHCFFQPLSYFEPEVHANIFPICKADLGDVEQSRVWAMGRVLAMDRTWTMASYDELLPNWDDG